MKSEINIKNLRLRTFIGFNQEEKKYKQDIIINIYLLYQTNGVELTDIPNGLDYKKHVIKKIIAFAENNYFNLLETLVYNLCKLIDHRFQKDDIYKNILNYTIEVDKVGALRYSESVSIKMSKENITL